MILSNMMIMSARLPPRVISMLKSHRLAHSSPLPSNAFIDSRSMYRSFSATTDEKQVVGDHIVDVIKNKIPPDQKLIRIYDAGMGDAKILSRVLRGLAMNHPGSDVVVVAKEISSEDVRGGLSELVSVFIEQPNLVINITNVPFRESSITSLYQMMRSNIRGNCPSECVGLIGSSGLGYCRQLERAGYTIAQRWATQKVGTTIFPIVSRMVTIGKVSCLPRTAHILPEGFDIVIASQPFRNSASSKFKCRYVLSPLTQLLRPGGTMIMAHSTGGDPGEDIMNHLKHLHPRLQSVDRWFPTSSDLITRELQKQSPLPLQIEDPVKLRYHSMLDASNNFHTTDNGIESCPIELTWSTVAYVSQLSERDVSAVTVEGRLSSDAADIIGDRLRHHGGLWFNTEAVCISRSSKPSTIDPLR